MGAVNSSAVVSRAVRRAPASGLAASAPSSIAVRGVAFDVAGVLYDATLWRRWLLRLVNGLGFQAEYHAFFRRWESDYLALVHCGRREHDEALESFLLASGLSWAQIDEVEAASRTQREQLEFDVRALPGAAKTICRLAGSGLSLLAWVDAPYPAARAVELLERLGVARHFQAALTSCDLGIVQPAPECYRSMVERLRLPAHELAFVSQDAAHLAGAKTAGLRTVAVNSECPMAAESSLTRIEDLCDLLQDWNGGAGDGQ
jgi:HAD superfamily hydrolase (TIGR01493 family)